MRITYEYPDSCLVCGSDRTYFDDYEEYEYPYFGSHWRCDRCGAHWVNKYKYTTTEVFTESEWEDES